MSKEKKYKTTSPGETQEVAREIVEGLLGKNRSNALVLALTGELGAGKTNLTQGVAEALGIRRIITSPTFVIMKRYDITRESPDIFKKYNIKNFYHLDAYRLNTAEELKELGWDEIISSPQNFVAVEWAEKVRDIIPPCAVWVEFKTEGEKKREITVK